MISKPKSYITVVTIPKTQIKKLDIAMGVEPVEQMEKAYLRLDKPDFMINGGFFDMSNGKTASNLIDEGVTKGKTCSNFGLIVDSNGIRFGDIAEVEADFIGGTPALIKNGKIDIDQSYGDAFNNCRHPRSAIGDNKDSFFLVTIDGRTNGPGMTLLELAKFMLHDLGCVSAINLDGGGSTRLLHKGDAINSPTENRKVDNFVCVWTKEEPKVMSKKKIFVDIGHGGTDPGAQANGIVEKKINLTVGLKLKELLLAKGFDVKLSRESDVALSLTERTNMANAWGADYFISVHHNAGGGDGWEVIHTIHTKQSEGDELAEAIGKEFSRTGQNMRRIFSRESTNYPDTDYYTVINKAKMPSIITEFAFLDTNDYKAVDSVEKLHTEAQAICNGICNHVGVAITDTSNNTQKVKEENIVSWEEKNKEFVKTVQRSIGVEADGLAGTKTIAAFENFTKNKSGANAALKELLNKAIELLK